MTYIRKSINIKKLRKDEQKDNFFFLRDLSKKKATFQIRTPCRLLFFLLKIFSYKLTLPLQLYAPPTPARYPTVTTRFLCIITLLLRYSSSSSSPSDFPFQLRHLSPPAFLPCFNLQTSFIEVKHSHTISQPHLPMSQPPSLYQPCPTKMLNILITLWHHQSCQ